MTNKEDTWSQSGMAEELEDTFARKYVSKYGVFFVHCCASVRAIAMRRKIFSNKHSLDLAKPYGSVGQSAPWLLVSLLTESLCLNFS